MRLPGKAGYWLERVRISLRNRGVAGTLKKAAAFGRLYVTPSGRRERRFDAYSGVDTSGRIGQYDLGVNTASVAYAVEYRPTPVAAFLQILEDLKVEYSQWTFVDLGSGKGRALLLAAQFPFKEIVGVEFSGQLVDVARENLAAYRGKNRACANITLVCADAMDYPLPSGRLLLYFNNPFRGPIMEGVIANIEKSLQEDPRDIRIVYWNPFCAELFERSSLLKRTRAAQHYQIYQSSLAGASVTV